MTAAPWQLMVPAVGLQAAWIGLVLLSPLRYSVWSAIALLIGSSVVYLIAAVLILKLSQCGNANRFKHLHAFIVGAALLFRLTAYAIPADFSDDLYRYRWEARLQAAGGNPYQVAPNDRAWAHLRDATFERIPGRDFRAVYGPLTELVYRLVLPLDAWKLPAAVADLGVLAGLWLLLPALGLGRERILIYAWCPLPVFEFWGNGHNDALMLCPLVFAFWARAGSTPLRSWLGFGLLTTAASAKIWPIALTPLFGLRWRMLIMAPVFALFLLPYGLGPAANGPFLSGFLGGWRNNDSIYGLLLWLTGDQYPAKYAAFALVAATIAWVWFRRYSVTGASLVVVTVMLLVSSNCHPWYLTWLLPLLTIHPTRGLLLWIALCPLFYAVLPRWIEAGEWNGSTPLRWLVYLPVFAALMWDLWRPVNAGTNR